LFSLSGVGDSIGKSLLPVSDTVGSELPLSVAEFFLAGVDFLGADFFFGADFFGADFFVAAFFGAAFLGAAFLGADFFF